VGALDGAPWETFGRISSLAFDSKGNLFILDGGNQRVVKVSPKGDLLAEIGRSGEGPGEFGAPRSLTLLPDGSLAVFDLSKRGFTLFGPEGEFQRTVPLVRGFDAMPGADIQALPSGNLVAQGMAVLRVESAGPQTQGDTSTRPVYRYSLEDGSSMTVFEGWRPDSPELTRTTSTAGGRMAVVYSGAGEKAFKAGFHFGVLPDGRVAVVDSVTYAVKLVDPERGMETVLERPIRPRRVTRDDREKERARRREAAKTGSSGGVAITGGGATQLIRGGRASELIEESLENLEFADQIPVIQDLSVDGEGRIWVVRSGEKVGEQGPIDLLAAEGRYLGSFDAGSLRMPDAFGPGGLVAYLEKDHLDVPRVEVKRLTVR